MINKTCNVLNLSGNSITHKRRPFCNHMPRWCSPWKLGAPPLPIHGALWYIYSLIPKSSHSITVTIPLRFAFLPFNQSHADMHTFNHIKDSVEKLTSWIVLSNRSILIRKLNNFRQVHIILFLHFFSLYRIVGVVQLNKQHFWIW